MAGTNGLNRRGKVKLRGKGLILGPQKHRSAPERRESTGGHNANRSLQSKKRGVPWLHGKHAARELLPQICVVSVDEFVEIWGFRQEYGRTVGFSNLNLLPKVMQTLPIPESSISDQAA